MSFAAQIASFSKKSQAELQRVRKGVCIKLFGAVVKDTPVDTGRLRANWQFTVGSPATSERAFEKGAAMEQALVIGEMEAGVNQTDGSVPVWLTNNVPYAHRIEFDGWSKVKAPQGMVRKNVIRFARLIKVTIRE